MRLPRSKAPNYFNPRDRRKLLGLTFLLAMVVIGFGLASDPQNWHWLTGPAPNEAKNGAKKRAAAKTPLVKPLADDELPPDAFRLVPGDAEKTGSPRSPAVSKSRAADHPPADAPPESYELALPRELLADVQDSSLGIRHKESAAYYALLAKARDIPLSVLERAARTDVSFVALYNDPELYRGQLITLDGELRRFTPLAAGENTENLDTVYEGWLFTEDGGRTNPFRVICTGKPPGLPVGTEVRERVRFTGYFFKRYGYPTQHGLNFAPLLLGKRMRWTPPAAATGVERGSAPYVLATVVVLGLAFTGVVWWHAVHEKRLHQTELQRLREPPREAIAALEGVETTDIHAVLRQLAEEDAAAEDASADAG